MILRRAILLQWSGSHFLYSSMVSEGVRETFFFMRGEFGE